MKRRISSLYTPLMKILPVPLIGGVTILIVMSILHRTLPLFPDGTIVSGVALTALAFFICHSWRLKFVSIDGHYLHVSGWFNGCDIPFSQVEDVYYSRGVGLVLVRLKWSTKFGRSIAFMPTLGSAIQAPLGSPSVVAELKGLANQAAGNLANSK